MLDLCCIISIVQKRTIQPSDKPARVISRTNTRRRFIIDGTDNRAPFGMADKTATILNRGEICILQPDVHDGRAVRRTK